MGKLKNIRLSGKLRKFTPLRPIRRNVTRWSSSAQMIGRYLGKKSLLTNPDFVREPQIIGLLPTPRETNALVELDQQFALQRENLDFSDTR